MDNQIHEIELLITCKLIRLYADQFNTIIKPETVITPSLQRLDFIDTTTEFFRIKPLSFQQKKEIFTIQSLSSIIINNYRKTYEFNRTTIN